MTTFFIFYTLSWSLACLAAICLMIRHRNVIALFQLKYWRFLGQKWKIVTFLIAATGLTVIAPYTDDATWDYIDAAFMAVLTFATAPWAIGVLYRAMRGKALVIGISGGIGLVTTRALLERSWKPAGKLSSLDVAVEQPMR